MGPPQGAGAKKGRAVTQGLVPKHVFDILSNNSGKKWNKEAQIALYRSAVCFALALGNQAREAAEKGGRSGAVREQDIVAALRSLDNEALAAEAQAVVRRQSELRSTAAKVVQPKRPLSAYFFYMQDMREELSGTVKGVAEFTKVVAARWKDMSEEEKKKYTERAAADKQRYADEMAAFSRGEWVPPKPAPAPKRPREEDGDGEGVEPAAARRAVSPELPPAEDEGSDEGAGGGADEPEPEP
eukprot:TRINITY_DN67538_c0_g1_i1.p1 TRINITY_DN67538_c0_g1~~TRINITY_DN67538_c0_g1_i1.p1  ORF type:complete len:270 (+),score=106.02 TRINITY_DN67538_c0_g1_i1:87-812(+)